MGSETYINLPVIDFSVLNNQNPDNLIWDSVKNKVFEAFQEYGCFQASIGVPHELQKSVYDALEHIFDLPLETKIKNTSERMFYGYVGPSTPLPLYESMGIDEPCIDGQVEKFTNLMWPQGNSRVCKDIERYTNKLQEVNEMVVKMIFESLDLEKHLNEHKELTTYVFKIMKYRVPEKNQANVGLHAHVDSSITTILHQNEVEGLEIKTKDEEWLRVKLSPNLYVVMVGETFNAWLNGRLHAPYHRVMMTGSKTRFSLALFALPKTGNLLKAMEEMVDEEHPLLFKPFDYGEFMKFLLTEGLGIEKDLLKAYCGVSN